MCVYVFISYSFRRILCLFEIVSYLGKFCRFSYTYICDNKSVYIATKEYYYPGLPTIIRLKVVLGFIRSFCTSIFQSSSWIQWPEWSGRWKSEYLPITYAPRLYIS